MVQVKKRHVTAFKCGARRADGRAFCTVGGCGWSCRILQGQSTRVSWLARKHTMDTGHETRIELTNQRGYRAVGGKQDG